MRSVRLVMLLGIVAALVSTNTVFAVEQNKGSTTPSVDWYMAPENKAALEAKLKECRNNPGELEETPICQNALTAESRLFARKPATKVKW